MQSNGQRTAILFRYWALFRAFIRTSFHRQAAYRPSFFFAVVGKTGRMLLLVVFWRAVVFVIPSFGAWDSRSLLYLAAVYITVETGAVITFHRNLFYYLPDMVRTGRFDFIVTRPISPLWHASFFVIDFFDLASSVFVVVLWIILFTHFPIPVSVGTAVSFLISLAFAWIAWYAISVIIASFSFRHLTRYGSGRMAEGVLRAGRYPLDAVQASVRGGSVFLLPLALIATFPTSVLLGRNTVSLALVAVAVVLFFWGSVVLWRRGMRSYSSASR